MASNADSAKFQYVASLCVNVVSMSYGAFCGWTSSSFLELQSEDSPLDTGPMSNEDTGWVGSVLCIGGIAGTVLFAWSAEKIGRKHTLLLVALPSLLGWLIIPFARNPLHLCIARFLGGAAGGGCFAVIPIYITELADDKHRGTLGTILVLACNAGILAAFVLGNFLNYVALAWIFSSLTIAFLASFIFLPETPQQLAKQNKPEEAERAMRYFRNIPEPSSKELSDELQFELSKLHNMDKTEPGASEEGITWQDLTNPTARKALFISLGLMVLNQFCGCFAMINYTATIFKQSGSQITPTKAAIVVGLIQFMGSYMSTILVERAGRKVLLLISAIGTGLGLFTLGLYSYLSFLNYDVSTFSLVPVASFSFIVFIASWGILNLPFLVVSEIMPPKIRSFANMFCMSFLWAFAFLLIKFLPVLTATFGMHGTMFMFGGCCFSGAVFIAVFLPETKGKSIEVILANL